MNKKIILPVIGLVVLLLYLLTQTFSPLTSKKRFIFSGGPAGGTFQIVANAVQVYKPVKNIQEFSLRAQSSAGSIENLRRVHAGKSDFAVVYSGHLYQGLKGMLKNDANTYTDVLALGYLYGAPAQLVVRKGVGIETIEDLENRKVGVGNAGSGAFANCEMLFSHLGLWDKIERNAMGYSDAAAAFGNKQLDAFWLFTAYPSGAVIMASQTNDIALLDLDKTAVQSRFYEKYPYFTKVTIPGGTYRGVLEDTDSFQDSAIWVANADVPDDVVYSLLSLLYSEDGIKHMISQKKVFREMSIQNGVNGIVTPLHPGAVKFWKEKGVL